MAKGQSLQEPFAAKEHGKSDGLQTRYLNGCAKSTS